jgi:hypothetical protein
MLSAKPPTPVRDLPKPADQIRPKPGRIGLQLRLPQNQIRELVKDRTDPGDTSTVPEKIFWPGYLKGHQKSCSLGNMPERAGKRHTSHQAGATPVVHSDSPV